MINATDLIWSFFQKHPLPGRVHQLNNDLSAVASAIGTSDREQH